MDPKRNPGAAVQRHDPGGAPPSVVRTVAKVQDAFGPELDAIAAAGDQTPMGQAVLRVVHAYHLSVTSADVLAICAGLHVAGVTAAEARRAGDHLLMDAEFRDTVRYARAGQCPLTAADFHSVLAALPKPGQRYTVADIDKMVRRFPNLDATTGPNGRFRTVDLARDGSPIYLYFPPADATT